MDDPQPPTSTHIPPTPPHPFSPTGTTLVTQGAEALLYRTYFLSPSTPAALKVRPSKPYRHEILDRRLTRQRVLAEARVLVKLSALRSEDVRVPGVLGLEWDLGRRIKGLDMEVRDMGRREGGALEEVDGRRAGAGNGGAWLLMEWIEGKSVKELLREWDAWVKGGGLSDLEKAPGEEEVKVLLRRIGRAVGVMHSIGGVVHGDLTSSNIMLRPIGAATVNGTDERGEPEVKKPDLSGEIVLIDFGLATQSVQDEDRAVDLYVLERAFGSTHPRQEGWFDQEVLQGHEGYRGSYKGANVALKRLEEVRLRGRKRSMVG